ncbi:hypothetical protein [Alteromonas sp. RKMC-009]|uniref:hypothetical protein n=1 Tax=Alteromonas sp. RKMC-009 TaxID=2267264 RepID=UPI000E6A2653|nr:hypothetical protein [Alteromonas sp. RKMC-009]AYA65825.1 hypothetical protein DS731_18380 [Alteromonas sp. RKMC-009]
MAFDQAVSWSNQANSIRKQLDKRQDTCFLLNFLVCSGLSVELYLKALMLVGRNGLVTGGHDLLSLYEEFPPFLKHELEAAYHSHVRDISHPIDVQAIRMSVNRPNTPPDTHRLSSEYNSFETTIKGIKSVFVKSRYFFEQVTTDDYAYIEYPPGQIKAVIFSLHQVYERFIKGDFAGKLT